VIKWTRVRYRVAQFGQWLLDSVRPPNLTYVRARLPNPTLIALFTRMSRADQHHGIAVARTLEHQGYDDPALIAAALLHDVGKSRTGVSVWARVIVVLGEWLLPRVAARWGEGQAKGLRRPFVVRQQHPAWGAEMAQQAGASPVTVRLIRSHHNPTGERDADRPLLTALHAADEE
jgi:putative nucleotidyltransferase with HDIG domain